MKTITKIALSVLALLCVFTISFAQDDVYYNENNSTKEQKTKTSKRKINSGYVFIDGKYIEPPYKVRSKGMAVYINGVQVTQAKEIKRLFKSEERSWLASWYSENG